MIQILYFIWNMPHTFLTHDSSSSHTQGPPPTHTHTHESPHMFVNSYCLVFSDEESDEEETSWRGRRSLVPAKDPITEVITQLIETNPPPGVVPLSQIQPQAVIVYGKLIPVEG